METSEEPERAPSSPTLKGLLQSMEEDEALGEVENGAQLDFFFEVFSDEKITPTWRPKKLWVFGDPRDGPFRPSSSFQEEFFHHRVRLVLVCQQHLQYPTVSFDVVRHTIPMSEVSFDTTVFSPRTTCSRNGSCSGKKISTTSHLQKMKFFFNDFFQTSRALERFGAGKSPAPHVVHREHTQ